MDDQIQLATQFEAHRPHLRAVAYRMLGSISEADDAVQDAWLRASRAGTDGVENLGGWLTTIVGRVCLNMLRARATRAEQPFGVHTPDPVVRREGSDPEGEAMLGESVGLALLVVLDTLSPDERLAFVLHDVFALPFDEIAPVLDTSTAATRQLASRARRRVKTAPTPDTDLARQREVVNAFFAAAREGDLAGLVAVLHPDVVLRSDGGTLRASASFTLTGSTALASSAATFADTALLTQPALINGAAGVVVTRGGRAMSVMSFVVTGGAIAAIDVLVDPTRLAELDLAPWLD